MSVQVVADDEWMVNRILLRGYIFRKYLNHGVPNDAVAVYSNYRRYEQVRSRLAEVGLISVNFSERGVESLELTDDGMRHVENLLVNGLETPRGDRGSSVESPVVTFIRKLKLTHLLPTRIGSRDAERLFKALVMIYPDGFFRRGPVMELINQMSDDISSGNKVILRKMVDSFDILYKIDDLDRNKKADFVEDVILGREILEKVAELSRIWRFYRYNPIALHAIVRYASLFLLGPLYRILAYMVVAIFAAFFILLSLVFGLLTEVIAILSIMTVLGLLPLVLLVPAVLADKFKKFPKKENKNLTFQ